MDERRKRGGGGRGRFEVANINTVKLYYVPEDKVGLVLVGARPAG